MDQPDSIRNKVEELIVAMSRAVQMFTMYGKRHKLVEEAIDNVYNMLDELLSEREEITIGIIGDEIAFEKEPF